MVEDSNEMDDESMRDSSNLDPIDMTDEDSSSNGHVINNEDIIVLPRGGVIFKQYCYHKNSQQKQGIYYKCSFYRTIRCMARLIENNGRFRAKGPWHEHRPPKSTDKLITRLMSNQEPKNDDRKSIKNNKSFADESNHADELNDEEDDDMTDDNQRLDGNMTTGHNHSALEMFSNSSELNEESSQESQANGQSTVAQSSRFSSSSNSQFEAIEAQPIQPEKANNNPGVPSPRLISLLQRSQPGSQSAPQQHRQLSYSHPHSAVQFDLEQLRAFHSLEKRPPAVYAQQQWHHVKCVDEFYDEEEGDQREDNLEEVVSVNEDTQQSKRLRIVIERSEQLRQLVGVEFERTGNTVKIKIVPKTSFAWQKAEEQA